MKKVYIGSRNPVKIACTQRAFLHVFPKDRFQFIGKSVESGVGEQPMNDYETYRGAFNRAENLKKQYPDGDYWVGIEGGVEELRETMHAFAWMVVTNPEISGEARTATFSLPERLSDLVKQGVELGHADDLVFRRSNSKQQDGAVGILTGGIIDRAHYYEHALILALIPFLNQSLY